MNRSARFLLPAMIFAAVFALLLAARPFAKPDRETDVFLLEVAMTVPASGEARLYYDQGNGLRLEDSSAVAVTPNDKPAVQRFRIPVGKYRQLRLDLLNQDASVVFFGARIVSLEGEKVRAFRASDWQSSHKASAEGAGLRIPTTVSGGPELALVFPESLVLAPPWLGDIAGVLVQFIALSILFGVIFWRLDRWVETRGINPGEAVSRLLEKAQQHPKRILLAFAVTSAVLSCYPVVFFGKSFVSPNYQDISLLYPGFPTVPGDSATHAEDPAGSDVGAMLWQNLPYSVVQSHALFQHAELPLWNRYNSSGITLLGQGISMFGDPLHVIVLAVGGAAWGWDIKFLLAKILFCFGLGWLVLATTKHFPTALLLTFSGAFLGFFSYRFNHPAFFSMCYAPWLLLCWAEITRARTIRETAGGIGGLLLASWVQLNSGSVKEAYMLLASLHGTGLLIFLLAAEDRRWRKLLHLAFAGVVFVLLSAPFWLTFVDALKQSYTAYDQTPTWQIQPGLLVGLFDDLFYRSVNRWNRIFDPSANFLILLGCLLALAGLRALLRDRVFVAVGLAALPAFALAFGVVPPEVIAAIPVLKNVGHVDNTFSCVLIVQLIVLAGFGFKQAWERMAGKEWPLDFASVAFGMGVLLSLFLGLTQAQQRVPNVFAALGQNNPTNPFFIFYSLSLIVAALALPWLARAIIRRSPFALMAVPLALLCLFALHWRHGMHLATNIVAVDHVVMNPEGRANLQASSPSLDFVRRQEGPFRTVGLGNTFYSGYNALVGLESIYGTDPLMNPYYRELLITGGVRLIWTWRWVVDTETLATTLPLYHLLNVRYFLEALPGTAQLPLKLATRLDLNIHENTEAWPRAFFSDQAGTYEKVEDFVRMIRAGDGQPFAAFQQGSVPPNVIPVGNGGRGKVVAARDYRLTNNVTEFTVDAPGAGVVVLTETYMPGDFVVRINGAQAEYFRINHAFRAIKIPQAGTYRISFAYWPKHFTASLAMAGLGLMLLAGGWVMISRSQKRSIPMPVPALEPVPLSHD